MNKFRWLFVVMFVGVVACSVSFRLPIVQRLDTRNIVGFRFADSILIKYTAAKMQAAFPLETALCYIGFIKDTTFFIKKFINPLDSVEITRQLVVITEVYEANIEETETTYVHYHNDIACDPNPNLIATIHSHPGVLASTRCDHSDMDALFHHGKQAKYVMSFVWCAYSVGVLWADGRRWSIVDFYKK